MSHKPERKPPPTLPRWEQGRRSEPRLPPPSFLEAEGSSDDEIIEPTRDWDPLPRNLDEIKAWYRASQLEERGYATPEELGARVIHQIGISLIENRPLAVIHLKRLIEYAKRLEPEDVRR
jgi:hypothetical protein